MASFAGGTVPSQTGGNSKSASKDSGNGTTDGATARTEPKAVKAEPFQWQLFEADVEKRKENIKVSGTQGKSQTKEICLIRSENIFEQ